MIAKTLEAKLGVELGVGEADMVQRFQTLRDSRMLPLSRGRNAEHLTIDEIVSGLLSIVAERPAFAAQGVKMLRSLRAVGGLDNAFVAADTLGQALAAALGDKTLLETVQEIRFSNSEVYTNAPGRAAIFYTRGDDDAVTYYVPQTAHSLFQPGIEKTYDPRDSIRSIIREIVIYPHVLQKIMREVREGDEYRRLMAGVALTQPR